MQHPDSLNLERKVDLISNSFKEIMTDKKSFHKFEFEERINPLQNIQITFAKDYLSSKELFNFYDKSSQFEIHKKTQTLV